MSSDQLLQQAVLAMVKAYHELNTIRARDGVPWTQFGHRSGVGYEYFSSVVDELNLAVIAATGKPAHCHPELHRVQQFTPTPDAMCGNGTARWNGWKCAICYHVFCTANGNYPDKCFNAECETRKQGSA